MNDLPPVGVELRESEEQSLLEHLAGYGVERVRYRVVSKGRRRGEPETVRLRSPTGETMRFGFDTPQHLRVVLPHGPMANSIAYLDQVNSALAGTRSAILNMPVVTAEEFSEALITSARRGSLVVDVDLLGFSAVALLSDPVQYWLTVHWFLERYRAWMLRTHRGSRPARPATPEVAAAMRDVIAEAAACDHSLRAVAKVRADGSWEMSFTSEPAQPEARRGGRRRR